MSGGVLVASGLPGRHVACGVLLALGVLGGTAPASAELLDRSERGFSLSHSATVAPAPDAAWSALTGEVGRWWHPEHTWFGKAEGLSIDPRAGGCFCERGAGGEVEHQRVVFVQPGRLLRLLGGLGPMQGMGLHGVVEWRLAPAGGGTRITLFARFGGYAPDDLSALGPVVDRVMGEQLGRLAAHLGGTPPEK